jgi:hypothetical protein
MDAVNIVMNRLPSCFMVLICGALCAPDALAQTLEDDTIATERQRFETEAKVKAPCSMPKPSDGAQIVVLNLFDAETLSSVAVGSQDVAVRTGAVVVEAGRAPLFLVLSTMRPTIWRFSGAVERIERIVLASGSTGPNRGVPGETPLAGVTGVKAERAVFLRHPHCFLYQPPAAWAERVRRILRYDGIKAPAAIASLDVLTEIAVPSLRAKRIRVSRPMITYDRRNSSVMVEGDQKDLIVIRGRNDLDVELKLFNPGGVFQLDATAVVASLPAIAYEVLPQQAGLIQLMQAGALSRDDEGDFLIERKIRLPADLNGGHKFRVMSGVPAPEGDPAHACIMVEDTGAALPGSRC